MVVESWCLFHIINSIFADFSEKLKKNVTKKFNHFFFFFT